MKKYIRILLVILLLFLLCISNVSAYDLNMSDYRLYSYKFISNDTMNELVNEMVNDERYATGKYYYFAFYSQGDWCYRAFLIPKVNFNLFNDSKLIAVNAFNGAYVPVLKLSNLDLTNGLISFAGSGGVSTDGLIYPTVGSIDYNTRTCSVGLATDYPFDITFEDINGNTQYFYHPTPYLADSNYSLSVFDSDHFLIFPNKVKTTDTIDFTMCTSSVANSCEELLFSIELNSSSPYYKTVEGEEWYEVPYSVLSGKSVKKGNYINYSLGFYDDYELEIYSLSSREVICAKDFTFSGSSGEKDPNQSILDSNKDTQDAIHNQTNKIEEQTEAIRENTETNKGIFESIKEVLSYINPFSENFFVYKLIELLIEGLKSLFVPADNFFNDYFTEIREFFSDRLGFLWTPFDIVIELLNKILNINLSDPIINIPDLYEPFTNKKLISSYQFNFNTLLENGTIKTMHDFYLVGVDALLIFAMINLAKRKIEGVFSN